MRKLKYLHISKCPIIKGHIRDIIYDLNRSTYYYIPKELTNFINEINGRYIEDINYLISRNLVYEEYLSFLIEKEIVLMVNEKHYNGFTPLNLKYISPEIISSLIFIIENELSFKFSFIVEFIEKMSVKTLTILVTLNHFLKLEEYLECLKGSTLCNIEILIKSELNYNVSEFNKLFYINHSLRLICFFNSDKNETVYSDFPGRRFFFTSQNVNMKNIDFIDNSYFHVNMKNYMESHSKNLFYNKKIILDSNGKLYADLSKERIISDLSEINYDMIGDLFSNNIWNISKNNIEVCKDCEHRYMCLDPRYPVQISRKKYYFNTECNYNPYIAKWQGEDGYLSLKDSGIQISKDGTAINNKLLNKINSNLYEN